MNKFLTILLFAILVFPAHAKKTPNLEDIYKHVDGEIEQWPVYMAQRQARIDSLKAILYLRNDTAIIQYNLCAALVDEYSSFQNDSALYYCKMLAEIAYWTKEPSKIELAKIKMARQAVKSGMYEAAMNYLSSVDTMVVSVAEKREYWRVQHFAYVEMAAYCYIWDKRIEYIEKEHECRLHLFQLLPKNGDEWLLYKAYDALLAGNPQEAEKISDRCMANIPRYGKLYQTAAFHRRFICESLGSYTESTYWQAECAISELRQGLTDQVGLWSLASKMEGDELERSYRYIRFSWDIISKFGINARSWQIAPALSNIEHQYQAERERLYRIISDGVIILAILTAMLAVSLLYVNRQKKRLAIAQRQLEESNNLLQERNAQLEAVNSQLSTLYSQLSDSSRAKEEYIVQLLEYNSNFIDKKEEKRRKASKMFRTGNMKELNKLLNSADKTGKELDMLLKRFDDIFLGLYPSFIDDFNALIREEVRINTSKSGQMNTPLRIFALMRLGIDKIPDVAKILHCSPQTIYNYRNKLRNSYLGDRDKFEEDVCRIGMPVLVDYFKR